MSLATQARCFLEEEISQSNNPLNAAWYQPSLSIVNSCLNSFRRFKHKLSDLEIFVPDASQKHCQIILAVLKSCLFIRH